MIIMFFTSLQSQYFQLGFLLSLVPFITKTADHVLHQWVLLERGTLLWPTGPLDQVPLHQPHQVLHFWEARGVSSHVPPALSALDGSRLLLEGGQEPPTPLLFGLEPEVGRNGAGQVWGLGLRELLKGVLA